jgi:hypothetical protein
MELCICKAHFRCSRQLILRDKTSVSAAIPKLSSVRRPTLGFLVDKDWRVPVCGQNSALHPSIRSIPAIQILLQYIRGELT